MQSATLPRLHVRDAHDAHVVFEATRLGLLQPITRRLNKQERALLIHSGAVFVWHESCLPSGLKRWTDGRIWGQSRLREPYLFYDEKQAEDFSESSSSPGFRFVQGATFGRQSSSALAHRERGQSHVGLVKQAYSTWVYSGPGSSACKWHIVAYFTYDDLPLLPTADVDPCLQKIVVPDGVYSQHGDRVKRDESVEYAQSVSSSPPVDWTARTLPSIPPAAEVGSSSRIAEDNRVIRILDRKFFGK